MLPVIQNLSVYQGDSFEFTFKLRTTNPNTGNPGPYLDLTGCTAEALLTKKSDGSSMGAFTADITDPKGGEVKLSLTPEETAALTETAKWDAQITFPSGQVQTYLRGSLMLTFQVAGIHE